MRYRSFPHVALSAHAHNRLGLQRTDEAWIAEQMADPATRVLVIAGNRLRPVDGVIEWVSPDRAPDGRIVLLGAHDGVVHLAVIVSPDEAPGEREEWVPLREVLPLLSDQATDQAPLLMHAIGLAEWHHVTHFCPRCGGALRSRAAGHELRCTVCDRAQFPRTDPAVIMAITHGDGDDEAILLGRSPSWPPGRYSTLAGFCEPGETLEDAVRREVEEEAGVLVGECRRDLLHALVLADPENGAHEIDRDRGVVVLRAFTVDSYLIKQTESVTHRACRVTGDGCFRLVIDIDVLGRRDLRQTGCHGVETNAPEVEPLAS